LEGYVVVEIVIALIAAMASVLCVVLPIIRNSSKKDDMIKELTETIKQLEDVIKEKNAELLQILNNEFREIERKTVIIPSECAKKCRLPMAVLYLSGYSNKIKELYFEINNERHEHWHLNEKSSALELYRKGASIAVQSISESFKIFAQGKEVSCCVKLLWDENDFVNNYLCQYDGDKAIITIKRSGNPLSAEREARDNDRYVTGHFDKLSAYIAFSDLVHNEDKTYEAYHDIAKYNTDEQQKSGNGKLYKSPNSRFAEYYNSTILVPIRGSKENLKFDNPKVFKDMKLRYDYFGFLCVDSKEENFIVDEKVYVDLLTAYANMLYIYFNRCRYLIQVCDKEAREAREN